MNEWKDGLNEDQLAAANTIDGPVLILAGAGSGKTKTMTSRICHMLEEGIAPGNILAITFTNKAADEMRTRLRGMIGSDKKVPLISTFHSFGYRLLRKYGSHLGYGKRLSIYDDEDTRKTLRSIIEENLFKEKLEYAKSKAEIKSIKSTIKDYADIYADIISKCKDRLIRHDNKTAVKNILANVSDDNIEKFCLIYEKYEKYLKKNNILDFDDLIEKCVFLLQIDKIREHINSVYTYINVDEYQDTSRAQFAMVRLLAGSKKNVCVVGDDYQSIYAFRGAVIENILNFPKYFEGCRQFTLKANYRSTSHIVDGAAAVIDNNSQQYKKNLFAARGEGKKIVITAAYDAIDEAYYIADKISGCLRDGNQYSDIAVLYRKNASSRIIEEALIKTKIPYTIYGGVGFYQRKEIKDIIAYMKILAGYDDLIALERIINHPARGIGEATLGNTIQELKDRPENISLMDKLEEIGKTKPKIGAFCSLMKKLRSMDTSDLYKFVSETLNETGLKKHYEAQRDSANEKADPEKIKKVEECVDNINSFGEKAFEFMQEHELDEINADKTMLEAFLEEISLYTDADKKEETNTVSLMTIHKSKGLEFSTVFLAAQDERLQTIDNDEEDRFQQEEERRLFYVGMTRAKDNLFITYAMERFMYGEYTATIPVSFINEIPEEHVISGV